MRGSKSGTRLGPVGTRPPRTARQSRPTDCQPAPQSVVPTGKRKLQSRYRDFEPRPPMYWRREKEYARLRAMPMQ